MSFRNRAEYNKHMKNVHLETPFPCPIADCERKGAAGFLSEGALTKHQTTKHSDTFSNSAGLEQDSPWPKSGQPILGEDGRFHGVLTYTQQL